MKFHYFHFMPWNGLPDDFKQKHSGAWVDLPRELYDPEVGHGLYRDYLDEVEHADQVGFDSVCFNEHHQNGYGMMSSPNQMASIAARTTKNANIMVLGNSIALYNPPIRVAEEFATIDVISGGRLIAGFTVGSAMDALFSYGVPPAILREKFREGVDLILKAWQSDGPFAFNGKYTKLRYVNPWPRTIQDPHPPVWVPGGGSVETWDYCIDNDFCYSYLSYIGYPQAVKTMKGFWETVEKRGVEPNPFRAGFMQFVAIADNEKELKELYSEHAEYFYNNCLYMNPGFTNPAGYASVRTIRSGLQTAMYKAMAQDASKYITWDDIIANNWIVWGTPESVAQQLEEAADSLNVGHMMILCQMGSMPKDIAMHNAKRIAEEVIPRLRNKFEDDWEDHWTPKRTFTPTPAAA